MFSLPFLVERKDRAGAIFASVRGVDRKIQIIKAAGTGLAGPPWDDLAALLATVKEVSDMRGQIAHATPVQNAGILRINVRTDEEGRIVEAVSAEKLQEGRFELRKQAKQTIVFTIEDLHRGYDRIDKLFVDLIDFVKSAHNPPARSGGCARTTVFA
jgi:hypothetical protein